MALQTSGAISLSDIQSEFGGSNPISLSEYYGAASGIPTSGAISLSNFYGASAVQYSLTSPTYFWLTGSQGNSIYWNDAYIGAPSSASTTTFSAGGYTYTRGSLRDTQTFKNGTFYYYELSRS
jgi:hypothetical protein